MKLSALTHALIRASEKAANIARVMRSSEALFSLLVEEKTGDAKNKRFVHDFKTLGDVLIQEMVRHDLSKEFPGIAEHIYGEESNKFTNTMGETIEVNVLSTQAETSALIAIVLNGNHEAASVLAETIHKGVAIKTYTELENVREELDEEHIGIWIDPIDGTAQFIHGYTDGHVDRGVYVQGLQCATVLIGVYNTTDGLPVLGVCNQPFSIQDPTTHGWQGRCLWGLCFNDIKCWHIPKTQRPESSSSVNEKQCKSVVMSSSEKQTIQDAVKGHYHIKYAAGAGYKIMCVLDRLVSSYVLSSGSTFKYDTCGPHAIIRSLGGGIVNLKGVLSHCESKQTDQLSIEDVDALIQDHSLRYNVPDKGQRSPGERWSNAGGVLAFLDPVEVMDIVSTLRTVRQ